MDNNNEIIKILARLPELDRKFDAVLKDSEKKSALLSDFIKEGIRARMPKDEIERISNEMISKIQATKCATPDVPEVSNKVAKEITRLITSTVYSTVTTAVKASVADVTLKIEHLHTHTTLSEMCKMASAKLRNWITGLACTCGILLFAVVYCCVVSFNNPVLIGKQYYDVYTSKYTTDKERTALAKNCYYVSVLPDEFDNNRKIAKSKIRHNKQIIRQRKAEARAKKGSFSKNPALER